MKIGVSWSKMGNFHKITSNIVLGPRFHPPSISVTKSRTCVASVDHGIDPFCAERMQVGD